ncbi:MULTISPECIES: hypothetical protein [Sporolactobacillus]|uniref:Uncharacterized protein n=1 Tax=Sporolactobacillus nakayamae TaxID=269670 RepID=A0A1I2VQD9_9BACL|nr:hypothetical protein [Sporolactobacillus nakayamae]SFG90517.1 hypothetical protein SAMN02982927_03168 [Sporolactobacillus nakayamae]
MFVIFFLTFFLMVFIIYTPDFKGNSLKKYVNLALVLLAIALVCFNSVTGTRIPDIVMIILIALAFLPTLLHLKSSERKL